MIEDSCAHKGVNVVEIAVVAAFELREGLGARIVGRDGEFPDLQREIATLAPAWKRRNEVREVAGFRWESARLSVTAT